LKNKTFIRNEEIEIENKETTKLPYKKKKPARNKNEAE